MSELTAARVVARLKNIGMGNADLIAEDAANLIEQQAALIEAETKRLALAEKTIAAFRDWRVERDGYAGLPDAFDAILDSYDAAKEAGL